MPSVYASGNARHSLPRTFAWSLTTAFNSPPRYCAGVCTRGKIRRTASLRDLFRIWLIRRHWFAVPAGNFHEQTQRIVDGDCIRKIRGDIGIKRHDVNLFSVTLGVLATLALAEVVFVE